MLICGATFEHARDDKGRQKFENDEPCPAAGCSVQFTPVCVARLGIGIGVVRSVKPGEAERGDLSIFMYNRAEVYKCIGQYDNCKAGLHKAYDEAKAWQVCCRYCCS